jgi:hypothetical protein
LTGIKLGALTKKSKLLGILTTAFMITLVVSLVTASSIMNPRVTYSGYGDPDNETGREGDLYVEIDTNVLWVFKEDAWEMLAIFPTVVNGTDGPIGPTGPAGADGKDGTQIYNELMYNCTDSLGNNGDFFLYANGTLNVKIDGSWMFYGSLLGPQGEIGPTGPTGPQGETGPMGPQGEIGPTGPTGADGIDGLNGIDGEDGLDGLHGINETEGTTELGMPWWIVVLFVVMAGSALAISVYALRKNSRK